MVEYRPTPSQQTAAESRGSSILVSAGAGSGKTKVLTERLMAYISDANEPADLDEFLVITFTRAAAGELRSRITDELALRLAADPGNRHLRRQSALCTRAQIGTIHSFCSNVLRENCHLIGLPPDFRIIDEDRAAGMKAAALERVLDERYESSGKYPGFTELADTAGQGRDDSALAELVLTVCDRMQCHARPERWAREQLKLLEGEYADAAETPWGREIIDTVKDALEYWSSRLDSLMRDMEKEEKIAKAYIPSVSETADGIREMLRRAKLGWDRAFESPEVSFPRLGTLRGSPNPELSERVKVCRNACKKSMEELRKLLYAPSEKLLKELKDCALPMKALIALTEDFERAYSADKRRAGFVDYSDLEHMTARLLTDEDGSPTELAAQLSGRYREIMVDEYQDVSAVQDTIFSAISRGNNNLFLVGDVKQSIYRFRLADPGIFTAKYLSYANADSASTGQARRIMLQENFRSRREILECANAVFSQCMSRRLGDIDYDEDASLKYGASYDGESPVPEIMLLSTAQDDSDDETPEKSALEARLVGRKILELMSGGITVSGRALEFSDIAILMRSANSVGGIYARELAKLGIPTDAGYSGDFFSSVEVSAVVSMLSVIDNPHKDVPLIAVLRSPVFGFSADELSDIRSCKKDGDFFTALTKHAEEYEKSKSFLETLDELRTLAPDMSANELMRHIINTLDLPAVCSAMTRGRERRNNLMELCRLGERFDETGFHGLHRFVLWLNQLAAKGDISGTAAGNVKIMTVHKSKGLEFPIVFLCDTARRFNLSDNAERVLVHSDLGLGPKVYDLEKNIQYPSLARNAIKMRSKRETLSEELRLLYVALTRPRERLYITAVSDAPDRLLEKLSAGLTSPIAPQILEGMSSPVGWLVSAALADGQKHIKISIHSPENGFSVPDEQRMEIHADSVKRAELERALAFRYVYSDAQELPSKLTATELKGHDEQDPDAVSIAPAMRSAFRLPDFARADKPLTGAERGIATHLALQYIDFSRTDSRESIENEIRRLCDRKFISEREREAVDCAAIEKLFRSELGKRMRNADMIKREFRFSLLCDASEVFGKAAGESLLLQGVVDCCIAEGDKLTVIDYKTDRVRTQAELEEKAEYYSGQLKTYAAALSRIFGMKVRECILYFLVPGKALRIEQKKMF